MWQYTGIPAISPHSGSRYPPLYAISVSNARTKCQTRSSLKFILSWECLLLPKISNLLPEVPGPFQKYPAPSRSTSLLPGIPISPPNIHPLPEVPAPFQKYLVPSGSTSLLSVIPDFSQKSPSLPRSIIFP